MNTYAALARAARRCGRREDDLSSIVLVMRDKHYVKSDAVLHIGAARAAAGADRRAFTACPLRMVGSTLDAPLPAAAMAAMLVPQPLRDALYDWISEHRYRLYGSAPACRLSDPVAAARFLPDEEEPAGAVPAH